MAGLNHQNGAEVAPLRINRVPTNRFGVRGLLSRSASVMKKPFVVEVRAGVEFGASPRSAFLTYVKYAKANLAYAKWSDVRKPTPLKKSSASPKKCLRPSRTGEQNNLDPN
jgi:hypothetical protein